MTIIGSVTPAIDFEMRILKKGQRAPKGWHVVRITAAELPKGWPPRKPYGCQCGCSKTFRIGDRVAVRNVKKTGGYYMELCSAPEDVG